MRNSHRKVMLPMSLIACLSAPSFAVQLSPDGTGQVLLYPYYIANARYSTTLSVTNSKAVGKAIKLRFQEANNGRDVAMLNIYLPPFATWTAGVFARNDPIADISIVRANLLTFDGICTVPRLQSNPGLPTFTGARNVLPFSTRNYTQDRNDSESNLVERTLEGSFQIIEMGEVAPNSGTAKAMQVKDCQGIESAWTGNVLTDETGDYAVANLSISNSDITAPTGGLYGAAALVNVAEGTYFNYSAEALDAFRSAPMHTIPNSPSPNLSHADSVSVVDIGGKLIRSTWSATLGAGVPHTGAGIDAVSSVLMAESISNEYITATAEGARSEWVSTFPTRAFYVDEFRSGQRTSIAPFTVSGNAYSLFGELLESPRRQCEMADLIIRNREAARLLREFSFVPNEPNVFHVAARVCAQTTVLAFNQSSLANQSYLLNARSFLGVSSQQLRLPLNDNGSALHDFRHLVAGDASTQPTRMLRPSIDTTPRNFVGLPVIGLWLVNLENRNARPNVQGFYGGSYRHRSQRRCLSNVSTPAPCE
jgi:hypothetical protein